MNGEAVASSRAGSPEAGIGGLVGFIRLARRFVPYVLPHWDKLVLRVLCIQGTSVAAVLGTVAAARLIDDGFLAANERAFWFWAVASVGISLLGMLFTFLFVPISQYLVMRVDLRLKKTMFRHVLRMSLAFHQMRPVGENMFRINADTSAATELAANTLPNIIERVLAIATTCSVLLAVNPFMAGILGIFLVCYYSFSQWAIGHAYRLQKTVRVRQQEASAILQEDFTAFPISKAMARERHDRIRYVGRLARLLRANLAYLAAYIGWERGAQSIWLVCLQLGYMMSCGLLVLSGHMSVGEYLALPALIFQVVGPLMAMVQCIQSLRLATVPAQRMLETLDLTPSVHNRARCVDLANPRGAIAFEDVSFRYSPEGADVLRGVSFRVEPGRKLAIVGASGAGKTSVFNLLMRFSDPSEGRITIDGVDLRDLRLESYLEHVSVVLQDNFLFSASVRDNILLGNPHASERQLQDAVERAGLWPIVEALPAGLETVLLEGGNLSAGQKQRIAIARAFIRDPLFLYLDEATSALDPRTEAEILCQLAEVEQGRTRIVIAHHITSVQSADEIVVLHDGAVVQKGRHHDLIQEAGPYARLWAAEAAKMAADTSADVSADVSEGAA